MECDLLFENYTQSLQVKGTCISLLYQTFKRSVKSKKQITATILLIKRKNKKLEHRCEKILSMTKGKKKTVASRKVVL